VHVLINKKLFDEYNVENKENLELYTLFSMESLNNLKKSFSAS
jgi:hypothetical protein